ncbi:MAG: hypothetical protein WKF73_03875 [Nocardioidaceae bacterium]
MEKYRSLTLDIHYLPEVREAEIGWFRLHLKVDSSLLNRSLALQVMQSGASEIYLNGKLIHKLGVVGGNSKKEVIFNPGSKPYSILFLGGNHHVLVVRYSFSKSNPYMYFMGLWGNPCFRARVNMMDTAVDMLDYKKTYSGFRLIGKGTFLLFLALLHFFFYLSYPLQRVNLYYTFFLLSLSIGFSFEYLSFQTPQHGQAHFVLVLISSLGFCNTVHGDLQQSMTMQSSEEVFSFG